MRVTVDVSKPLRRWILIDSAARGSRDWYDIQYENVPNFCFSCGRLGHDDLLCSTPGTRDDNGDLPFNTSLRAPEDKRRAASSDNSGASQSNSNQEEKQMPLSLVRLRMSIPRSHRPRKRTHMATIRGRVDHPSKCTERLSWSPRHRRIKRHLRLMQSYNTIPRCQAKWMKPMRGKENVHLRRRGTRQQLQRIWQEL